MFIYTNLKSFPDFLNYFKDDQTCKDYFEQVRFKSGLFCAHCGHIKVHRFKDGRFRCYSCKKDFTLRTGTIFGESKVSFHKWFIAIYLLTTNSISSVELAQKVGVTQKTAWFMNHRLRSAMKHDTERADEIYTEEKISTPRKKHPSHNLMGRRRKIHKPLPHIVDEVLKAVSKGKGAKKNNKNRPLKKKRNEK